MAGEKAFQTRILRDLRALPQCYCVKIERAAGGTLDIHACIAGRFVAIEVKGEGGRLSPLQKYTIGLVEKAAGYAFAVWPDQWDDVYTSLKAIPKKRRQKWPSR